MSFQEPSKTLRTGLLLSSTTSYPGTRRLCLEALSAFQRGLGAADDILEQVGRSLVRGSLDRAFLMDVFCGVLRNLSLLDAWTGYLRDGAVDAVTRDLLRMGLYQILLSDVAEHAAVNETVALAGRAKGLVNAILRRAIRERNTLQAFADTLPAHVRWSHPEFLFARWRARFGLDETLRLMAWNNRPARMFARINTLRITAAEFLAQAPEGIEALPGDMTGVALRCRRVPIDLIDAGLVYIQDPSTLKAPLALAPQPGELVLDACAAPGGKATYLSALMGGSGTIIATDSISQRLSRLQSNVARLGAQSIKTLRHDWLKDPPPKTWEGLFDKILVDVPCSNTGVIRRRVDVRWRLAENDFERMSAIQLRLLNALAPLLKKNGALVYSTCSIEPEENQNVVEAFLESHPEWYIDPWCPAETLFPQINDFDGAFFARLLRA